MFERGQEIYNTMNKQYIIYCVFSSLDSHEVKNRFTALNKDQNSRILHR